MHERLSEKYLQPYREAVEQFGPGFLATLWSSREAQQLRFDVMIDLAGLEACTIVDAGCGTGDFAAHLHERGVAFSRYIGIDAVPQLIEAAAHRKLPRCEFILADLMIDRSHLVNAAPDFTCISGTLNTMDEREAKDLVKSAFEASSQGVIFNFLSNRPQKQRPERDLGPARRFHTLAWLDWAMSQTSLVSFTQDYMQGHDATILMRREP